jgi:hypothetical protein
VRPRESLPKRQRDRGDEWQRHDSGRVAVTERHRDVERQSNRVTQRGRDGETYKRRDGETY